MQLILAFSILLGYLSCLCVSVASSIDFGFGFSCAPSHDLQCYTQQRTAISKCIWDQQQSTHIIFDDNSVWAVLRFGMLMQVDLTPILIVDVRKTEDIVAAVNCARSFNVPIVPRNGGHSFMGHSSTSGILLSLSSFNSLLSFDEEEGTMTFQAGASLGDVYREIKERQLLQQQQQQQHQQQQQDTNIDNTTLWAFGGGTEPSVGLSGHTLCVGYGPFGRYTGATMDQILGYELVLADGSVVAADSKQNSDLFNVLKGSCMSAYGIVTKVHLRLTKLPSRFTYISLDFRNNVSAAASLFWSSFRFTSVDAPAEYTTVYTISIDGGFTYNSMYLGSEVEARKAIEPFLSTLSPPSPFVFTELSPSEAAERWAGQPMTTWNDIPPLEGRRKRVCKAGYIQEIPDQEQVLSLFSLYLPSGVHSTQIKVFGGRVSSSGEGGIFVGRSSFGSFHSCITFTNETDRASNKAKIETFHQGWTNTLNTTNQCVSYIEDAPNWRVDLYGSSYSDMISAKKKFDPNNLFRNSMGVDPNEHSD